MSFPCPKTPQLPTFLACYLEPATKALWVGWSTKAEECPQVVDHMSRTGQVSAEDTRPKGNHTGDSILEKVIVYVYIAKQDRQTWCFRFVGMEIQDQSQVPSFI